jgi:hypothetical protein
VREIERVRQKGRRRYKERQGEIERGRRGREIYRNIERQRGRGRAEERVREGGLGRER